MSIDLLKKYMNKREVLHACASIVLLTCVAEAQAGSGPSCTINQPQNSPVSVTTGGSVIFQGVVTGGIPPYDVTWIFNGGTPSSASESGLTDGERTAAHNIAYTASGSFTTTLTASDSNSKRTKSCEATFSVNVAGNNNPPIAQDDEYNTQQDTELTVVAPGILNNDIDPDGDPISVELVSTTGNGALNLRPDGGFVYLPNAGFTGSDSFTYVTKDASNTSNIATVVIGIAATGTVSINSTSANASTVPANAVANNRLLVIQTMPC